MKHPLTSLRIYLEHKETQMAYIVTVLLLVVIAFVAGAMVQKKNSIF